MYHYSRRGLGYEGYLDIASCSQVAGWAWDPASVNTSLAVDVYDNGVLVASSVPANQFRADLQAAGKGNGIHAFSYVPNFNDGKQHIITAMISGTSTALIAAKLPFVCPAAPVIYSPNYAVPAPPVASAASGSLTFLSQPVLGVPLWVGLAGLAGGFLLFGGNKRR